MTRAEHQAGRSRSEKYRASELDLARLHAYARRVAAETTIAPGPAITTKTWKPTTVTEARRTGFLGLRTVMVDVVQQVEVSEVVVGPHWVLHRTDHHIEDHCSNGNYIEYMERKIWVVCRDGALKKVWDWEEFTRFRDGNTRFDKECTAQPMTEADILRLDYADKNYESGQHGRDTKIWGCREPGRLQVHAKGVGLSRKLKELVS